MAYAFNDDKSKYDIPDIIGCKKIICGEKQVTFSNSVASLFDYDELQEVTGETSVFNCLVYVQKEVSQQNSVMHLWCGWGGVAQQGQYQNVGMAVKCAESYSGKMTVKYIIFVVG